MKPEGRLSSGGEECRDTVKYNGLHCSHYEKGAASQGI